MVEDPKSQAEILEVNEAQNQQMKHNQLHCVRERLPPSFQQHLLL